MVFRRKDVTTRLLEAQEKRAREETKSRAELQISKEKAEIALLKFQRKGQIELERKLAPTRKRRVARGLLRFGAGLERIGAEQQKRVAAQQKRAHGGPVQPIESTLFGEQPRKRKKEKNIFQM